MTFKLRLRRRDARLRRALRDQQQGRLMQQVSAHAAEAHGIEEVTPEIAEAVEGKIITY